MKASSVTIRDVADRAGVALSSVSRVLNGHPAVSEPLRQRVLSAVAELGYQPDYTATSLRRGSTMTIAFLVRDIASPLFSELVKAAERVLEPLGYSVLLMNSDGDPVREAAHLRILGSRRVDGLIVSLSSETDADTIAAMASIQSPMVLIDRTVADIETSSVLSDHFGGVSAATRHLAASGHTRIGLITGPTEVLASRERLRGYKAGLKASGLAYDSQLVRMDSYEEEFGRTQTRDLLDLPVPVTAVIAGGATLSYGVLHGIRESGLSVPTDITMVACDSWRSPELFEPHVAVVSRDLDELGRTAATLLLEGIQQHTFRSVTLPTELVVGAATAVPAI